MKFKAFEISAILWLYYGLIIWTSKFASGDSKSSSASSRRIDEQLILSSILNPAAYDSHTHPGGNRNNTLVEPTVVEVSYLVRDVSAVDYTQEEMKIQLTLHQSWTDPRLSYSDSTNGDDGVTLKKVDKIWTPDLFVVNTKETSKPIISPQSGTYARIFSSGQVQICQKLNLNVDCPMKFVKFPFDRQTCEIRLASYFGRTTKDVIFKWKSVEPVQVNSNMSIRGYTLKEFSTNPCNSHTDAESYSCLLSFLTFKRDPQFFKIQVFIPGTLLIIISWLGFWLPPKQIIPRLILTLTTLFVGVTQTSRLNEKLPQVSYTKAIDVWTGFTVTFLLTSLIETIIVFYLFIRSESQCSHGNHRCRSSNKSMCRRRIARIDEDAENSMETVMTSVNSVSERTWLISSTHEQRMEMSKKIDLVFRFMYLIMFILFSVLFYAIYCTE